MDMLLLTTAISFLGAFMPTIIKPILSLLCMESKKETMLQSETAAILREMSNVSMVDEFARHARLQRKLNKVQEELRGTANARLSSNVRLKVGITYLARIIMGVVILVLVWRYRYVPVVVLPAQWLQPFGLLVSWPTGVAGGVSITAWVIVTGTVTKLMAASLTS